MTIEHEMKRTVAIVGMGAIGQALSHQVSQDESVEQIVCLSRHVTNIPEKARLYVVENYDAQSIQEALKVLGLQFDVVIIALGILHETNIMPEKRVKEITTKNLSRLYQVNAMAPAIVIQEFLSYIPKKSPSRIAVLSARVGSISDNRLGGWYSYRMSKAALNMFIKTLSIELKRTYKQAIAMSLHPGTVDSDLSKPFQANVPEEKLFTPDFSAQRLWQVIHDVQLEQSGGFFAWDGAEIPF